MAAEKPVVLVVDDEADVRKLASTLLRRAGIDTIEAASAAEAAKVLRQKPLPNLVLLDMMLPDVSGLEFLRQMRAKALFDDLPVIILSALADPDQIREGLAGGADRYLTKPYLNTNLVPTVQDVLRSGRVRR